MFTKDLPAGLLVLAAFATTLQAPWLASAPATGVDATRPTAPGPAAGTVPILPASAIAIDDYRLNLQDGVTPDAYGLAPPAAHDAAHNRSMAAGVTGRQWSWW